MSEDVGPGFPRGKQMIAAPPWPRKLGGSVFQRHTQEYYGAIPFLQETKNDRIKGRGVFVFYTKIKSRILGLSLRVTVCCANINL
jgi:hypothetical protein